MLGDSKTKQNPQHWMKLKLQCQLLSWVREEVPRVSVFPDGVDTPEVMTEIFITRLRSVTGEFPSQSKPQKG